MDKKIDKNKIMDSKESQKLYLLFEQRWEEQLKLRKLTPEKKREVTNYLEGFNWENDVHTDRTEKFIDFMDACAGMMLISFLDLLESEEEKKKILNTVYGAIGKISYNTMSEISYLQKMMLQSKDGIWIDTEKADAKFDNDGELELDEGDL